jgi:tetratricopeptide (TPR) repeat protein
VAATTPARPPRTRRALIAAAGTVIAVIALFAGWRALRPASEPAPPPEAARLNNEAFTALGKGDVPGALVLVRGALAMAPRFVNAQLNLGRIYDFKGDADSASAVYAEIIRQHPRDRELLAMTHYQLGDLNLRTGASADAVKHLEQSVALDSLKVQYYNGLGLALLGAHRPQDALGMLEKSIRRFPGAAPLFKNAALAAMELQRDSLALRYLDGALRIDSRFSEALGLRARARARLGNRDGALADWRLYEASDPPPAVAEREETARALAASGVQVEGAGRKPARR